MASSQIDQKSTRPEARPDEEVGKSQSEATQRPGEAVKGRPNFGPEAAEARWRRAEARQRPGRARGRGGGQKLKLLSPDARLTYCGRLRLGKPELNNAAFSFSQTFSMGQRYIDA